MKRIPDLRSEDSHYDIHRVMEIIGIEKEKLAAITGLSEDVIEKNIASDSSDEALSELVYVIEKISMSCGNEHGSEVASWFRSGQVYWSGLSAMDLFLAGRGKGVLKMLRGAGSGESLGGS